jgi:hypothetical protein
MHRMPDERAESIKRGIAAPEESNIGKQAERENAEKMTKAPAGFRPDSGMGGTSDVDSPADEAAVNEVVKE